MGLLGSKNTKWTKSLIQESAAGAVYGTVRIRSTEKGELGGSCET